MSETLAVPGTNHGSTLARAAKGAQVRCTFHCLHYTGRRAGPWGHQAV